MENEVKEFNTELLAKVDEFEDNIKLIDTLTKQYNQIKAELKKAMVQIGKDNDLEQIKWTTPKGTKITCSIGHCAVITKVPKQFFDEEMLKKDYPDIYKKCCREIQESVIVKNASYDTLKITLAKDNEE